jgi:hypothetical protein
MLRIILRNKPALRHIFRYPPPRHTALSDTLRAIRLQIYCTNFSRRWLSVLVCNPGNLWRLALPKAIYNWSLTSLQQGLVKTGKACPVLLVVVGPELSEGGGCLPHAGYDRGVVVAGRLGLVGR